MINVLQGIVLTILITGIVSYTAYASIVPIDQKDESSCGGGDQAAVGGGGGASKEVEKGSMGGDDEHHDDINFSHKSTRKVSFIVSDKVVEVHNPLSSSHSAESVGGKVDVEMTELGP